jgi:cell wall-associated NlpC family hydrolase
MLKNEGAAYVWGANDSQGVPELLRYYQPSGSVSLKDRELWTLKGLDCSGLLYEAADGATPRNTSDLVSFGKPVPIEGLTVSEIARRLEPLDLIVWKGHVIIVLDKIRTIESCLTCSQKVGVTIRSLTGALEEVMKTRTPVNHYPQKDSDIKKPFVIRRWYN